MSATANGAKPTSKRGPAPGGIHLGRDHTAEARRLAAAVREVLAGERTPTQAAQAIGVSVPRYYQIESRALRGLLDACQPKPRGPGRSIDKELTRARHESQRLQRELTRQQALLRAAQRTVGLTPPAAAPTHKNGKKIRKRRTARALSVAVRLQQQTPVPATPAAAPCTEATAKE